MWPAVGVRIYCPPCHCAVRTALLVCSQQTRHVQPGKSEGHIRFRTRIDERIPCSCCPTNGKLKRLRSLAHTINEWDLGLVNNPDLKDVLEFLDRPWLEKRIYSREVELCQVEKRQDEWERVSQLMDEVVRWHPRDFNVVLGEASQCCWIVQTKPFPWSARGFQAQEMFTFSLNGSGALVPQLLGRFTSLPNPQDNAKPRGERLIRGPSSGGSEPRKRKRAALTAGQVQGSKRAASRPPSDRTPPRDDDDDGDGDDYDETGEQIIWSEAGN